MDIQSSPITITRIADGCRIKLNGPIHTNVAWLDGELDRVVKAKPKKVELDLVGSEYISSIGLGTLVGFNKRINEAGGKISIVGIRKKTLQIFKIAYLDRIFAVDPAGVVE